MPEISIRCLRCLEYFQHPVSARGRKPLRCEPCRKAAWEEQKRVYAQQQKRAFGSGRRIEELADALVRKLADMDEPKRLEIAEGLLRKLQFSIEQVDFLLHSAYESANS
jgi:hypothetical protein